MLPASKLQMGTAFADHLAIRIAALAQPPLMCCAVTLMLTATLQTHFTVCQCVWAPADVCQYV